LAERYLEKIAAPAKHLVWFEHSGHNPCYEEPDRFNAFMAGTVLRAGVTPNEMQRS
jgi:pimeloyl-ACP methyl ester carboxylesterase